MAMLMGMVPQAMVWLVWTTAVGAHRPHLMKPSALPHFLAPFGCPANGCGAIAGFGTGVNGGGAPLRRAITKAPAGVMPHRHDIPAMDMALGAGMIVGVIMIAMIAEAMTAGRIAGMIIKSIFNQKPRTRLGSWCGEFLFLYAHNSSFAHLAYFQTKLHRRRQSAT